MGKPMAADVFKAQKKWYESASATIPLFLLLPFAIFYWMLPFISPITIGNDYPVVSIGNQLEIQYSIKHGSFPLYMLGYSYGNSFSAMTLGQPYHPIAWIAAFLPGYWQGQSLEINTLLHLLSLGFTHFLLFLFLRRLRLNLTLSFLLSLAAVYNMRMLDMFRYGASLENYTAFLQLCVATSWYFIRPTRIWGPLWIVLTTYLLICAGHPQWMYFGLWGAALLTLVMPFYLPLFLPELHLAKKRIVVYYMNIFGWVTVGILLASVFTFPFYFDFLQENAGRVNQSFAWATLYQNSLRGNLNILFNPFASDVHGSFGGSIFFLVAALAPLLVLFRVRVPLAIWFIWGIFIISMLYMLGSATPVFHFFWSTIPFVSNFRIPGRISMIIPYMAVLILAWLFRNRGDGVHWSLAGRVFELPPYAPLAAVGAVLFVLFNLLPPTILGAVGKYTPDFLQHPPHVAHVLYYVTSLVILVALVAYGFARRWQPLVAILLILVGLLQVVFVLRYGTWIGKKPDPTNPAKNNAVRTLDLMDADKKNSLACVPVICDATMISKPVMTHLRRTGRMDTRIAWISNQGVSVPAQEDAYARLARDPLTNKLFIENLPVAVDSGQPPPTPELSRVELLYSSYNRLVFHTACNQPAYLVFSAPYAGNHWRAWLGGAATTIYRANGVYQAVRIPAGEAIVEFRYWSSAAFWGAILSCLSAAGMATYLLTALRSSRLRILYICLAVSFFTGLFFLWYHSLYTGDNLGTQYVAEFRPR